ncbi:MAG: hypothetical protein HYV07_26100 [Deltaproteobacteria bacterium]|nr:hypothetical protein [Deltaproteobacteria bacterium]
MDSGQAAAGSACQCVEQAAWRGLVLKLPDELRWSVGGLDVVFANIAAAARRFRSLASVAEARDMPLDELMSKHPDAKGYFDQVLHSWYDR